MRQEDRIRDHLAAHLHLVEEGLQLVQKEYMLRNALGAKGFVDILAKDGLGHLVVIEIKRSDKTAREAIHELFKYTGLLLQNEGVGPERVRAVLVSTHWHELRVPFSAFARAAPFSAHGVHVELDSAGLPASSHRVTLESIESPRRFSPHQVVYLYLSEERREGAIPGLFQALEAIPLQDFVILSLDYSGDDPRFIYRSALYLAVDRLSGEQRSLLEPAAESSEDFDAEADEWWLEQWALSQISFHGHEWDDCEAAYSQKLAAMLQGDWHLAELQRSGITERARATLSDAEIVTELKGFAGGENHEIFMRAGTPDIGPSWRSLRESLSSYLEHRGSWRVGFNLLLDEIEQNQPDARVALRVYDQDPLIGFTHLMEGTDEYLPDAELFAHSSKRDLTIQAYGFLDWDGTPPPASAREAYEQVLKQGTFGILLGSAAEEFLALHGLRYGLARRAIQDEQASAPSFLERAGDDWQFVERPGVLPQQTLRAFMEQHRQYLVELVAHFRTVYRSFPAPG